MIVTVLFLLLLPTPTPTSAAPPRRLAPRAASDAADEQYQFIAGLCEEGLFELAVPQAQAFLEAHPRHPKAPLARYRLASALFELDRPSEAAPHFASLSRAASFEYRAESALRLGQCELLTERYAEARDALRRALASDQAYLEPIAAFFLGEAEFHLGEYAAALRSYEQCLASPEAASYHDHALRGLAWSHHRLGNFMACSEAATRFLRQAPEHDQSAELRFLLGDACSESGRLEEAESAWKRIESGDFALAALRGRAYLRSRWGDERGAAAFFASLLEAAPGGEFAHEAALQCAAHLLRAGAPQEALLVLQHGAAGEDGEVLYWRARALSQTGARAEALATLERALPTARGELAARIATARGDLLFDLGRLEESAAAFGMDDSDYALHAAATAQLNSGHHEQALELCANFLREHGESPYARRVREVQAEALFQLGRHGQALSLFRALAAEEARPDADELARLAARVAWCRYFLGELDRAAADFAQVVERHPGTAAATEAREMRGRCLFELAEAHAAAGEGARAIDSYREFLEHFPADPAAPRARYGLAWALRESGDPSAALVQLALLLAGQPEIELEPELEPELELRAAALELTLSSARDLGDVQLCLAAWRRLTQLEVNETRIAAAALTVAATLRAAQRDDVAEALLRELRPTLADPALQLELVLEELWIGLDAGRVPAAEAGARAALELAPEDPRVLEAAFFVGEAHYAAGAAAQAVPLYAAVARAASGSLHDDALYKLGFAWLGSGDHARAAQAFERLVEEESTSELFGESLYLAGECRFRAGEAQACVAHLARLRRELPEHAVRPKALFRLGLAARSCGDEETAASALTEFLKKHADSPQRFEALLEQGRALAALGKPRAARAAFDALLVEAARVPAGSLFAARARLEIGRQRLAAGDHEEALSQFLKVSLLYAESEEVLEARWLAGRCLEARGARELAIQQYRKLVEAAPESRQGRAAGERLRELGD